MYDAVSKQRLMKFSESNNRENPLNLGVSIVCLSVRPSSYRLVDEAGNKTENGPCHVVEVARHNRERPWDKMIRYTKIGAFFEGHSIASLLLPPHRSKIWACPSLIIWYYLTHFSLQLFTYYYINKYVLLCFSTISHLCSKLHDICQYCWQLISADNIACMYYRYM